MRDFFGIEANGYRFEIYDLMSLVTVLNVAFVLMGFWWAPILGIVNCCIGLVVNVLNRVHLNNYITQVALMILNIYFLTLQSRGDIIIIVNEREVVAMRDFFGIKDNSYRFEIYDLMSLITVLNVAFVLMGFWWAPILGIVNCCIGLVVNVLNRVHLNNYITQLALIILNIYFLTLQSRSGIINIEIKKER